jgi:hypothetical protein
MRKMLTMCCAASIGIAASASLGATGLFSATGRVIAVMADELFVGEAEGHLDGSGMLAIRSQKNAAVSCRGQFTSSATLGGAGQLQCSDGATATFIFQRLDLWSGHGAGSFARGPMSFTYGLTADESRPYLKLPLGRKLEHNGENLRLADISQPPATTSGLPA